MVYYRSTIDLFSRIFAYGGQIHTLARHNADKTSSGGELGKGVELFNE